MRKTGIAAAGAMLATSMFFSAQMFGELHTPLEILPQPPLPTIPPPPVFNFIDPDILIPVASQPLNLRLPGTEPLPDETFLPTGYAIGYQRMIPPIPLSSFALGGYHNFVADSDLWIPPGAFSRFSMAYDIGHPGGQDFWPPGPGSHFRDDEHHGVLPPTSDEPPAVPEPVSLTCLVALSFLLRRPARRHNSPARK